MKNVADLKRHLESTGQSPEDAARVIKISNMTIRRLLKRPGQTPLPEKYALQFGALAGGAASRPLPGFDSLPDFGAMLEKLRAQGEEVEDTRQIREDLDQKLKLRHVGRELRDLVRGVAQGAFGSQGKVSSRALCLGALLYFINPLDIVPDALGPVGFLDDFAVLSLVAMQVGIKGVKSRDRSK